MSGSAATTSETQFDRVADVEIPAGLELDGSAPNLSPSAMVDLAAYFTTCAGIMEAITFHWENDKVPKVKIFPPGSLAIEVVGGALCFTGTSQRGTVGDLSVRFSPSARYTSEPEGRHFGIADAHETFKIIFANQLLSMR